MLVEYSCSDTFKERGMMMSTGWTVFYVGTGTILNVAGIFCAACVLFKIQRSYGRGPLFPWTLNSLRIIKIIIRRLMFWSRRRKDAVVHVGGASATATRCSARMVVRVGFPDGITDAQKMERLIRAITGIYSELDEDRQSSTRQHGMLVERIEDLSRYIDRESRRLETLSRETVSGDVPLQLVSLLLIGFGTVLTAVPTLWQLLF